MRRVDLDGTMMVGGTESRRGDWTNYGKFRFSVRRLADLVLWLIERQSSRNRLLELSDAQLKDIGLSRQEAIREGTRPFYDLIPHMDCDDLWKP